MDMINGGFMRVISGSAKGHRLVAPEGLDTRPTTDRIKETLFNIISNDVYDSSFLDVFCGSGAIGIEALSREAKECIFIDNSEKSIEALKKNLKHTKLEEKAVIIKKDVISALKELGEKGEKFDIIFIDPPYLSDLYKPVLKTLAKYEILNKEGFIIIEHSKEINIFEASGFKIFKTKDFKKTTIMSFLTWED